MTNELEQVAAQVMGCDVEDLTEERYDIYGLRVFSNGGEEWAVGTEAEADEACKQYIKDNLWSFRASFILSHTKIKNTTNIEKCLESMQSKLSEDCNELVAALIPDLDHFVSDAISADGRGMLLSQYDSEEQEIVIDGEYFYAYRIN
jgi:hypothetical protein